MFDAVKEAAPAESAADRLGLIEREFAQCGSIVGRHTIHLLHHRRWNDRSGSGNAPNGFGRRPANAPTSNMRGIVPQAVACDSDECAIDCNLAVSTAQSPAPPCNSRSFDPPGRPRSV